MAWPTTNTRTSTPQWRATRQHARKHKPQHCQECTTTKRPLELDHITPVAEGGTDHPANLQWLCTHCHREKTNAETRRGQQRRQARLRLPQTEHPGLV